MRTLFLIGIVLLAYLVWQFELVTPPAFFAGLFVDSSQTQPVWFVGDVFLGRNVDTRMRLAGNDYPFQGDVLPEDAFVVANFESAAPSTYTHTPDFTFKFNVRQAYLQTLAEQGFSILSLANNHAYDAGAVGYAETAVAASTAGVVPVGASPANRFAKLPAAHGNIAVVAFDFVQTPYDPATIEVAVAEAAAAATYVVAFVHWGDEYAPVHNFLQAQIAADLAAAGADAIVGHHPHVIQDIAMIDDTIVFYSLGNYIFDQYFSTEVQQGLVLKLVLGNDWAEWTLVPVTSEGTYIQPNRLTPAAAATLLRTVAERSDVQLRESIADGVIRQTQN